MLEDKLIGLGLDENRANSEALSFFQKMKSNPKFETLLAQAGESTVEKTAQHLYDGIIARNNAAVSRKEPDAESVYSGPSVEEESYTGPDKVTRDTLERIDIPYSDDYEASQKPDYVGIACRALKKKFNENPSNKALLFLLVPLVFLAIAAVVTVFCGIFLFLILLSVLLIALTCAVSVGGTGASLAGLIYGAVKIFTGNIPVGLYEIGIGIIILGMTIFAGIVFYNCAVRFLPIALKQTGGLLKYFFSRLADNFKTAKGVFSEK